VETASAVGAASPTTSAAVSTAAAWCRSGTSSAIDTTMPTPRTTGRNVGAQSGVRDSRVLAHSVVASIATASVPRANQCSRLRHRTAPPIPTSAPIAGTSATV
jgi:hypothetical protein